MEPGAVQARTLETATGVMGTAVAERISAGL